MCKGKVTAADAGLEMWSKLESPFLCCVGGTEPNRHNLRKATTNEQNYT